MGQLKLNVQVLPWERPNSREYEDQRPENIPHFTIPCPADKTIHYLQEKIAARFTDLHPGKPQLNIKNLSDGWGGMLHGEDFVGDIFEDRRSEGVNIKAFTVLVARLPPSLQELRNAGANRFASVPPESSAAPRKRAFDHYRLITMFEEEMVEGQIPPSAPLKRQRLDLDRESVIRVHGFDRPVESSEREVDVVDNVQASIQPPRPPIISTSSRRSLVGAKQDAYNSPQSLANDSPHQLLDVAAHSTILPGSHVHAEVQDVRSELLLQHSRENTPKSESSNSEHPTNGLQSFNIEAPHPIEDQFITPALSTTNPNTSTLGGRPSTTDISVSPSLELARVASGTRTMAKVPEKKAPVLSASNRRVLSNHGSQQPHRDSFEIDTDVESSRYLTRSRTTTRAKKLAPLTKNPYLTLPHPKAKSRDTMKDKRDSFVSSSDNYGGTRINASPELTQSSDKAIKPLPPMGSQQNDRQEHDEAIDIDEDTRVLESESEPAETEKRSRPPVVATPKPKALTPFIPGDPNLRPALPNGPPSVSHTTMLGQTKNANRNSSVTTPRHLVSSTTSSRNTPKAVTPETSHDTKRIKVVIPVSKRGTKNLEPPLVSKDQGKIPSPRSKAKDNRKNFLDSLFKDVGLRPSTTVDPNDTCSEAFSDLGDGTKKAVPKRRDEKPPDDEEQAEDNDDGSDDSDASDTSSIDDDDEETESSEADSGDENDESREARAEEELDNTLSLNQPQPGIDGAADTPPNPTNNTVDEKLLIQDLPAVNSRSAEAGPVALNGVKLNASDNDSTTVKGDPIDSQTKIRSSSRSPAREVISISDNSSEPATDSTSDSTANEEERDNDDVERHIHENPVGKGRTDSNESQEQGTSQTELLGALSESWPNPAPPMTTSTDQQIDTVDSGSGSGSGSSSGESEASLTDSEDDVELPPVKETYPNPVQSSKPTNVANSKESPAKDRSANRRLEIHHPRNGSPSSQSLQSKKALASSSQSTLKAPSAAAAALSSSQRYPTLSALRGTSFDQKSSQKPNGARQSRTLKQSAQPSSSTRDDDDDSSNSEESSGSDAEDEDHEAKLPRLKDDVKGGGGDGKGNKEDSSRSFYRRGLKGLLKGIYSTVVGGSGGGGGYGSRYRHGDTDYGEVVRG